MSPHTSIQPQGCLGHPPAPWLADCGDGFYRNPVLYADYSDPDVIRVGEDYWMTSSSFSHVPGLPILHSRDLVNWSLVNHALPRLVPELHFSQPRHGAGVWAPSLRYHAGKYWIFQPDPDFGLYVLTAEDPSGRWSDPVLIKPGKGLIDPCPLWDDNGQAWLVHGWAKSRSGICNRLTLHQIDPVSCLPLDEGRVIIDGDQMPGWKTIEGPKLYKRNGWYYVFAPAGGVAEGYQAVFRSRNIQGPYESRIVLAQGATSVNGPHQGAWVETQTGEHWFFHFQEIPAYGRVVHLQPMYWACDDWPVMGVGVTPEGAGEPVSSHAKPGLPLAEFAAPVCSDPLVAPDLGLQWQWQGNPAPGAWAPAESPAGLRLRSIPMPGANHWQSTHLLLQKFPAPAFSARVVLDSSDLKVGEAAGLIVFGYDYAWLGQRCDALGAGLVLTQCIQASEGGREQELFRVPLASCSKPLHLQVQVAEGGACQFAYSLDGQDWRVLPGAFHAVSSKWVGAKVGLFASAPPHAPSSGSAVFHSFIVTA